MDAAAVTDAPEDPPPPALDAAETRVWQYILPFERPSLRPVMAHVWIPPRTRTLRGLVVAGQTLLEREVTIDPAVRAACAAQDVGVLFMDPHPSGTFRFWREGNRDGEAWLKLLAMVATRVGHPELQRVPWISVGHSTGGLFARQLGNWKPERLAGTVQIKTGNFFQVEESPPVRRLAGIPMMVIRGQVESVAPGGIQAQHGRETAWILVREDLLKMRAMDPTHLVSLVAEPSADHHHAPPEQMALMAMFIRKVAETRLPRVLPAGDGPISALSLRVQDGWLSDPNLEAVKHTAAPHASYAGDKTAAMWHFDGEMAAAVVAVHRNWNTRQIVTQPSIAWLDEGDGWVFRASAGFGDTLPAEWKGRLGGMKVTGHATTPTLIRPKSISPVLALGDDKFRVLRPGVIHLSAYNAGDDKYVSSVRWTETTPETGMGAPQQIDFPPIADFAANGTAPVLMARASSGLAVHYQVDEGPLAVVEGRLVPTSLPAQAQWPLTCTVTAHQVGRRTGERIAAAVPVSRVFKLLAPTR